MRRLCHALVLFAALVLCTAAASDWKKVVLKDVCSVALPSSWEISAGSSKVLDNAYGPGVSCRTLLTAQAPGVSAVILMYWPYQADSPRKFASDMADLLRSRNTSRSFPNYSETKIAATKASSVTYQIDSQNDQKVTAFLHGGKAYCLILSYSHAEEYTYQKIMRRIIGSWQF